MKKVKVGVVGLGMVGGNLHRYFQDRQDIKLYGYDIAKESDSLEQTLKADVIFLCVPTPYLKTGHNLEAVYDTIRQIREPKTIVIKSTVVPETTKELQKKYPEHKFLFIPEFLTEANSWTDTIKPDSVIVGYTDKSFDIAFEVAQLLPVAPRIFMNSTEAELVKYCRNTYLANKVVFFNLIYDVCDKLGIDYENVKKGVIADPRIGGSHMNVFCDGGRGAGGTCFPKDLATFVDYLGEVDDIAEKYFDLVQDINEMYLNSTGKTRGHQYEI